jgi:hypothetical protein
MILCDAGVLLCLVEGIVEFLPSILTSYFIVLAIGIPLTSFTFAEIFFAQ